ncbi:MAG: ABC transporter ATP-binding protein [Oscillospiraceae bacterium]|nr:ABC transporter ATP-binding protein [Oscillospiraceae bacterium]
MIKKLIPYVKGYWTPTLLAPLLTMGEVVMEVYIPYLMSRIIDEGITLGDRKLVFDLGLQMIVCAILSLLLGIASQWCTAKARTGFSKNLRADMFRKVQMFSFANIDHFSTGSLITRLTTDVISIENAFSTLIHQIFRNPIMIIFATVMAFRINRQLCNVFLVAIPVLGLSVFVVSKKAHPFFMAMMDRFDTLNSIIEENLTAIRVVKAFVRRDKENEKFIGAASGIKEAQLKAEHVVILTRPALDAVIYGTTLAICWFGGKQMIAGTMMTGEFLIFIQYIRQILFNLNMLSMVFIMIVMSGASIDRVIEVLDEIPDISDEGTDPNLTLDDGSVKFEHVNFTYKKNSENYILTDINLDVHSGETIGIIGGTGSAKSTLVQLIPRLYDVNNGAIIVGGHDVREYPLETLRDSCAMVLQKNLLFSGSIRDNLKWGKEDATDEEIIEACKAADAHNFIMSFPHGYDTELGQGGVNVSGGQKQRLCIARALLKHPKILILDDSTSAVDTATDHAIREALKEKIADTTTFIIAQRIASVHDADRVIVLDNGEVNGFDTPENLLKTNKIYQEVYESQQKGARENG